MDQISAFNFFGAEMDGLETFNLHNSLVIFALIFASPLHYIMVITAIEGGSSYLFLNALHSAAAVRSVYSYGGRNAVRICIHGVH